MTVSDRELLELAARAAGYVVIESFGDYQTWVFAGLVIRDGYKNEQRWNPLTDDGDALRLACELRLDIFWNPPSECVTVESTIADEPPTSQEYEEYRDGERFSGDRSEALRRAIVRAAAEIGRSMS